MAASGLIDGYLDALAGRLGLTGDARAAVLEEVESHLLDAVDWHMACGLDPVEATRRAISAFGGVGQVGKAITRALRDPVRPSAFTRFSGAALIAGTPTTLVLATWSNTGHQSRNTPELFAIAFFTTVFGIVGLFTRHRRSLGRLGRAGIALGALGLALAPLGGWGPLGVVPFIVAGAGWACLVLSFVNADLVPGWASGAVFAGTGVLAIAWSWHAFHGNVVLNILLGAPVIVGLCGMGIALVSERVVPPPAPAV